MHVISNCVSRHYFTKHRHNKKKLKRSNSYWRCNCHCLEVVVSSSNNAFVPLSFTVMQHHAVIVMSTYSEQSVHLSKQSHHLYFGNHAITMTSHQFFFQKKLCNCEEHRVELFEEQAKFCCQFPLYPFRLRPEKNILPRLDLNILWEVLWALRN